MRILYTAGFKLSVVKYMKKHCKETAKSHFVPLPTQKNKLMDKARGTITEVREEQTFFSYTYCKMI
jgi:hypothetical protein